MLFDGPTVFKVIILKAGVFDPVKWSLRYNKSLYLFLYIINFLTINHRLLFNNLTGYSHELKNIV